MSLDLKTLSPVIDAALDAVVIIDTSGLVRAWNRAAESTFGWTANEAMGQPMGDLIVPERLQEAHQQGLQRFLRTREAHVLGQRVELAARRRNGDEFLIELTITEATFGTEEFFVGYLRDISHRRESEERLRASEANLKEERSRLTTFIDHLPVGVCFLDLDGTSVLTNPAYRRYVPDNVLPSRLKDAENRWVAFDEDGQQLKRDQFVGVRALRGETVKGTEFLHKSDNGSSWVNVSGVPLRNDEGAVVAAIVVVMDIEDLKRAQDTLAHLNETLEHRIGSEIEERIKAEEALRQSQKMEAMGQLTGGVAHDFNNLLTPIIGGLDLLQRSGQADDRAQRLISGALASAERARTLVHRLLAFARRQPLEPRPVDVARLVREMAELVDSTTGPRIRVTVDAGPDLPSAWADANQLEMAILNLAVNARDAMPDGGSLDLSVRRELVPERRTDLDAGAFVVISVTDTGAGMDEYTLNRAVDPFFSTKGVGGGTGLGLSMAHGLAAQLGGALRLQSAVGFGTKVEFWLRQAEGSFKFAEPQSATTSPKRSGVVLLVDDEELGRTSTAEMLAFMGFDVVQASTAEAALNLINGGLTFDHLVTDHLMPGMTGTELADLTLNQRTSVGVLIISGYADLKDIREDLPRLTKPFTYDELSNALGGAAKAEVR